MHRYIHTGRYRLPHDAWYCCVFEIKHSAARHSTEGQGTAPYGTARRCAAELLRIIYLILLYVRKKAQRSMKQHRAARQDTAPHGTARRCAELGRCIFIVIQQIESKYSKAFTTAQHGTAPHRRTPHRAHQATQGNGTTRRCAAELALRALLCAAGRS